MSVRVPAPDAQVAGTAVVRTWLVDLDGVEAGAGDGGLLSPDERARAGRFRFDRHRRRFVACRAALRRILGTALALPPGEVVFEYGPFGKPHLAGGSADGVAFNVSHSEGYALIALTRTGAVGVDIERIVPIDDLHALAATVFSTAERAELAALPGNAQLDAFFNGWTRKEAYIKARGDGLHRRLDGFDVTLAGTPRLLRVEDEPAEPVRWTMTAWTPVPGYAAALCVEGQARSCTAGRFRG